MDDFGHNAQLGRSRASANVALMPFTLQERCEYLHTASSFFLLGTLLLAIFLQIPLIGPAAEAVFLPGWIYLAGASSDDRVGWALFIVAAIVAGGAFVASAVLMMPAASFWSWVYFLFFGPYFPTVYAPVLIAHAVLFAYLTSRFAGGPKRPDITIGAGSIALLMVAIAGLLSGALYPAWPIIFMPVGYGLVAWGSWRQVRRLRSPVETGMGP